MGHIDKYEDRIVDGVTGFHKSMHSNEHVKSLSFKKRNHMHLPHGMGNIFKNIVSLDVFRVGLRSVHHQDLEQFPNLQFVSFNENYLHKLESDVFKYNPLLEVILLYKNQIATVDLAFKDLNNLRYLEFTENPCYSGEVKNDKRGVSALIQRIYNHCA